jgi:hypothetical protein
MMTSAQPLLILDVASAMDWSPEEQKRLMVMPQTGADSQDLSHLHALLPLGEGAAHDHVVHVGRVQGWNAGHEALDDLDAELVGPRPREATPSRTPAGAPDGFHDNCFTHDIPPS